MTVTTDPSGRAVLRRRIRLLVAATITYNMVEAVVALGVEQPMTRSAGCDCC